MNNGYFSEVSPLKRNLIKLVSTSLRKYLPTTALNLSQKIILRPVKRTAVWSKRVEQFNYQTRHGEVKAYKFGQGPIIWLIHGWSGCGYQFWPFMQKLAERGFCTITFDFPAHGHSDGNRSSLPHMIQAFDDLTKQLPPTDFVITHSMGASIVANSQWLKNYQDELMIIAPILETYNFLKKSADKAGFDEKLFDKMVNESLLKEKVYLPDLDAIKPLTKFTGNLKIIHDTNDKFAPLNDSKKLAELSGAELHITKNLGHGRILQSRRIVDLT